MNFHPEKRQMRGVTLSLISLIDVLFLLVIFFLLSTKFIVSDALDLNLSTINGSTLASTAGDSVIVTVTTENKFLIEEKEYDQKQFQDKIKALLKGKKDRNIVLMSQEKVTVQNVVTAIDKIQASGGYNISLAR
jgi:biopolymer transport protein ExbD